MVARTETYRRIHKPQRFPSAWRFILDTIAEVLELPAILIASACPKGPSGTLSAPDVIADAGPQAQVSLKW